LKDFFEKLKNLTEHAYYTNNNQRVVFVAHSMGNPMTLYFLNHMTTAWKDKFVESFVSLAGVWGGAAKPIRLMISGTVHAVKRVGVVQQYINITTSH